MARALAPANPSAFKVSTAAPIKARRVSLEPSAPPLRSWLVAPDFATWPPPLSDRFKRLLNSGSGPAPCQIPAREPRLTPDRRAPDCRAQDPPSFKFRVLRRPIPER